MKNITKRVEGLEHRHGRRTTTDRAARLNAGMDVLMADDAGRDAVLAFESYARRHHPNARVNRAAFEVDPRVAELYERVVTEAARLKAAWWLGA